MLLSIQQRFNKVYHIFLFMLTSLVINNRFIIIIAFIITLSSFFDNIVAASFLYSYENRSSLSTLTYFTVLWSLNLVIEFFLIYSILKISRSNNELRTRLFSSLNLLTSSSVVIITASFFFLIIQLFENQSYDLSTFTLIILFNLVVSMLIITALILKLSFWLKRKKNFLIFLYMVAFSSIFLTLFSSLIALIQELEDRPSPISAGANPWDRISTRKPLFYNVYEISLSISFGFVWLGTSVLLKNYTKNYSRKIGKGKYWILASLPLIYYVSSFSFILDFLNPLIFQYPYLAALFTYLFGGSKQIGGFFFALSLIIMSRNIGNINLKYYLTLAAVGIMTLFSSIQISILHIMPYPPFGLITLSTMPISSYLVLVGIYYSARSISYDKEFLRKLEKRIKNEPESFLNAMGSSEWANNLEMTVNNLAKNAKDNENDVASELSPEDIRNHIAEVMKELKREGS